MSIVTKLIDDYKANRISWNRLADALANRDYDPPAHHRNMTYEAIESVDRFADGTTGEIHKAYCEGRLTRSEYNAICDAILATHPKPVAAPPLGMVKAEIWDPAKHPRGQPDNAGEFGPGGGSPSPANITSPLLEPYDPLLISPQYEMAYVSPNGKGGPRDNPQATIFSSLPTAYQRKILRNVKKNSPSRDLTPEKMLSNLEDVFQHAANDPVAQKAITWYNDANAEAAKISQQFGLSMSQSVGLIAATSPQTDWDSNIAVANFIAKVLHADEPIDLPPDEIDFRYRQSQSSKGEAHNVLIPNGKRPSQMTSGELAWSILGQARITGLKSRAKLVAGGAKKAQLSMGAVNVAKAVRIYRGDPPADILSGHKVRSFFNNISDPDNTLGRNDVTVDTHAVSAAAGYRVTAIGRTIKAMFEAGSSTPANTKGAYALFADAYRSLAARHGLTPNQAQAIVWTHWQTVPGVHEGYREVHPEIPNDVKPKSEKVKAKERESKARAAALKLQQQKGVRSDHPPGARRLHP